MQKKKLTTVVVSGVVAASGFALVAPGAVAAAGGSSGTASAGPSGGATATAPVEDRSTRVSAALQGLVSDGTLTQAQADKVASTLAEALPHAGPRERGLGRPGRGAVPLEEVATAIGVTLADLRAALDAGTTLAQVAEAKGMSKDALVDKLVAAAKARLATELKEGRLTQDRADRITANLEERITRLVTSPRPPRGHRGPDGPGHGDVERAPAPAGPGGSSGPEPAPEAA